MADMEAELKHMVMSFRVSELQVLLGYAGRNKGGRKQELLQRSLMLVEKGSSPPVQLKIRELYRQIFACNRRRIEMSAISEADTPLSMQTQNVEPLALDFSNSGKAGGKTGGVSAPSATYVYPVYPDVRFKRLPFYDILGELFKPTSLIPTGNSRFQESYFAFHLTPQQAQDIAMCRDYRPGIKSEYAVQIQLRFCLLETSCEQEDNFPPSICVRINNKMAQLPYPIPTTKPGVDPKRPGRPVDITSLCRLSPTVANQINVSWASVLGRGYCLAVFLVRRLTSDDLLQRLKQFGNSHSDHTKALIKEKLAHDPDSEVATTSLRVSLLCPLGKMRMSVPCRASTCTHLQCFDASTFLLMNEKKPTWLCPVCNMPAPFEKLVIDGYFVEICRQSPGSDDIVFSEDGSWNTLVVQKETLRLLSPATEMTSQPQQFHPLNGATGPSQSVARNGAAVSNKSVIDLTGESSDEDDVGRSSIRSAAVSARLATPLATRLAARLATPLATCSSPAVINLDVPSPVRSLHSLPASPSPASSVQYNPGYPVQPTTSRLDTHPPAPLHGVVNLNDSSMPPNLPPSVTIGATYAPNIGHPLAISGSQQSAVGLGNLASGLSNMSPINLEALSEAEFEEFLHGLSWGV